MWLFGHQENCLDANSSNSSDNGFSGPFQTQGEKPFVCIPHSEILLHLNENGGILFLILAMKSLRLHHQNVFSLRTFETLIVRFHVPYPVFAAKQKEEPKQWMRGIDRLCEDSRLLIEFRRGIQNKFTVLAVYTMARSNIDFKMINLIFLSRRIRCQFFAEEITILSFWIIWNHPYFFVSQFCIKLGSLEPKRISKYEGSTEISSFFFNLIE